MESNSYNGSCNPWFTDTSTSTEWIYNSQTTYFDDDFNSFHLQTNNINDKLFGSIASSCLKQGVLERKIINLNTSVETWKDQYLLLTTNRLWFYNLPIKSNTQIDTEKFLSYIPLDTSISASLSGTSSDKIVLEGDNINSAIIFKAADDKLAISWIEAINNRSLYVDDNQMIMSIESSIANDEYITNLSELNYFSNYNSLFGILKNIKLRKYIEKLLISNNLIDLLQFYEIILDFQYNYDDESICYRRSKAIISSYLEPLTQSKALLDCWKSLITNRSIVKDFINDSCQPDMFNKYIILVSKALRDFTQIYLLNSKIGRLLIELSLPCFKKVYPTIFIMNDSMRSISIKDQIQSPVNTRNKPILNGLRRLLALKSPTSTSSSSRRLSYRNINTASSEDNDNNISNWEQTIDLRNVRANDSWWSHLYFNDNFINNSVKYNFKITPQWLIKPKDSILIFLHDQFKFIEDERSLYKIHNSLDSLGFGSIIRFGLVFCKYYNKLSSSTNNITTNPVRRRRLSQSFDVAIKSTHRHDNQTNDDINNIRRSKSQSEDHANDWKRFYVLLTDWLGVGRLLLFDPITWSLHARIHLKFIKQVTLNIEDPTIIDVKENPFDMTNPKTNNDLLWQLRPWYIEDIINDSNTCKYWLEDISSYLFTQSNTHTTTSANYVDNTVLEFSNVDIYNESFSNEIKPVSMIYRNSYQGLRFDRVVYTGQLLKRGQLNKAYKKRWFVLLTDNYNNYKLRYYKNELGGLKGEIKLSNIKSVSYIYEDTPNSLPKAITTIASKTFLLLSKDRTWELMGQSSEDVQDWVRQLKSALVLCNSNNYYDDNTQRDSMDDGDDVEI